MSLTGERPDYGPFELPKKILDSAFSPQCYKSHFSWHVAAHSLLLWHPAHPSGIEETNLVPLGRQPSEVSAIGTWPKNTGHRSLKNFHWGLRSSGYWPEFGGDCSHHCPSWLCRGERSIKIGVSMVWFYWFGLNIWVTLYKPTLWALGHKIKDNNTYHTEWLWV